MFLILLELLNVCSAQTDPFATLERKPTVVWSQPVGEFAGPISANDKIVVIGCRGKATATADLVCRRIDNGEELWRMQHSRLDRGLDVWASGVRSRALLVRDRVIYYSNRGEIVCLDAKGFHDGEDDGPQSDLDADVRHADVVWIKDLRRDFHVFKRDEPEFGGVMPSPVLMGENIVCATGNGSTHGIEWFVGGKARIPSSEAPACISLSISKVDHLWSFSDSSRTVERSASASPLVIEGTDNPASKLAIFLAGNGKVYGLSGKSGISRWQFGNGDDYLWGRFSPVAVGNQVVICDSATEFLAPSSRGRIVAFKRPDLLEEVKSPVPNWILKGVNHGGIISNPVYSSGILFVLNADQTLLAIEAIAGNVLWSDHVETHPQLAGGMKVFGEHLLVAEEDRLVVYRCADTRKRVCAAYFGSCLRGQIEISGDLLLLATDDKIHAVSLSKLLK